MWNPFSSKKRYQFSDEDRERASSLNAMKKEMKQVEHELKVERLRQKIEMLKGNQVGEGKGGLLEEINYVRDVCQNLWGIDPAEASDGPKEPEGFEGIIQGLLKGSMTAKPPIPNDISQAVSVVGPPHDAGTTQPEDSSEGFKLPPPNPIIVSQLEKKIPKMLKDQFKAGKVSKEEYVSNVMALYDRLTTK